MINPNGTKSLSSFPKSAREKHDSTMTQHPATTIETPFVSSKYAPKLHLDLSGVVKSGMTLKPMMSTIDEYPLMPQSQRDGKKSSERDSESGAQISQAIPSSKAKIST